MKFRYFVSMFRMKFFLVSLSFSAFTVLTACPACNVHNYLYSSVLKSPVIYKGVVIEDCGEGRASVVVLNVIRADSSFKNSVSDTVVTRLHTPGEKIGETFIFLNPGFSRGPTFELLSDQYETEIIFLSDTSREIKDVTEAILMVEGVSTHSNRMGMDYIENNYLECFDSLTVRINSFRTESFSNPDMFFANYRMGNLCRALLLKESPEAENFIFSQIDSVSNYMFTDIDWNKPPFRGETPAGEMLRSFLTESGEFKLLNGKILSRYFLEMSDSDNNSGVYFAYAFSFTEFKIKVFQDLNGIQKNRVATGMVLAALWNKYWFRHNERDFLAQSALKLSTDETLNSFIREKFNF